MSKPHVAHNSGNNEWYTPPEIINAARATLGYIALDPASSEVANRVVGATKFFTAADDGLALHNEWRGTVWMNPPYARGLVQRFCSKLVQSYVDGGVSSALVLVNNATETVWFQQMLKVASAVCFLSRRVKFLNEAGEPVGAPLQGQAVLYFGGEPEWFVLNFHKLGACVRVGGV